VVLPFCITPLCNYKQTGVKIVCYEKQQLCVQERETDSLIGLANDFTEIDSDIKNMKSIMDHINGYPKIYNFTLQVTQ
jgi:hypothetical protein